MLLVTGDGTVLAANRSASALSGFSAAELVKRKLSELVVQSSDVIMPLLRTWSRSNILLPGTLTIIGRDGEQTACRCEGAVFRPRSGARPAVILVRLLRKAAAVNRFIALNQRIDQLTSEVSRRRRLEQALDAQHEWLRVTLESIGDAVIAAGTDGRISFMNSVASSLTGVGIEDALGRPLVEV
ncbi:MAG TPA: PAS domain-containing protein, partial [Woeseiaceae bacterium]|nr:PAS domain-containing protein [Woeseiaceae bacterium]